MIRGVDDPGAVRQSQSSERLEDPPDLAVQVAAGAVVGCLYPAGGLVIRGLIEGEKAPEVVEGGVIRSVLEPPLRGRWKVGGEVAVEPPWRPDEGRVGTDERQKEYPGRPVARMLAQPPAGIVSVAHVVAQIARISPARLEQARAEVAEGGGVTDTAEQIADAPDDMQRLDLLGEAVVVLLAAEVQFAYRIGTEPLRVQPVAPA